MLKSISLNLIDFYQRFLRPLLPVSCRFMPSCSEYAKEAISKYGFWKGSLKSAGRLMRCHPFSAKSGFDPVR